MQESRKRIFPDSGFAGDEDGRINCRVTTRLSQEITHPEADGCNLHTLCRYCLPLGVPPQTFQPVERTALTAEDVDDEVEVVEQDPFRSIYPFHERRPLVEIALERLADAVGNRG